MIQRVILIAAAFAVLAASVRTAPATAAADDGGALLAKHRAYVGWQDGDGAIKTLRESGTVTYAGRVTAQLAAFHRGPVFRLVNASASAGTVQNGFTGRVLWWSNENGFTVPMLGEPVRYIYTRSALFDERLTTLPASVVRSETIDGTAVTWVRVQPEVGVAAELAVDPATGAFKRAVLDPNGKYETRFDVLGYTDTGGGKRVMSSWRYTGEKSVYAYTNVEANGTVTDDDLHPPKQTATWTFDASAAAVPLELTTSRILVGATVNGVPGKFILDTGADGIAMTDTFARRAGAKRAGKTEISGIGGGGNASANVYKLDTIAFGANVLHDVLVVTGLDERGTFDADVAGLIGFDLLAGAIVDMDLDRKTLRIMDPEKVQPDNSRGVVVRVDLTTGQPRVGMTVGGRVPVLATLDSGNPLHVLFSQSLISRDRVTFFSDPTSLGSRIQYYGVNGTETAQCGQLQSLELGPVVYRPVPACASPSQSHNDVLVGLDFLRAFNIVFDYPEGYLLMSPRQSP
ncbi:MAG TPA: aspartyl protease family protein [Candidatus Elarobacter sp.]|jgi:predicted aspartyl protease|nr:aspartyl protease family protein [Candidatus Elarobacter sp.]